MRWWSKKWKGLLSSFKRVVFHFIVRAPPCDCPRSILHSKESLNELTLNVIGWGFEWKMTLFNLKMWKISHSTLYINIFLLLSRLLLLLSVLLALSFAPLMMLMLMMIQKIINIQNIFIFLNTFISCNYERIGDEKWWKWEKCHFYHFVKIFPSPMPRGKRTKKWIFVKCMEKMII